MVVLEMCIIILQVLRPRVKVHVVMHILCYIGRIHIFNISSRSSDISGPMNAVFKYFVLIKVASYSQTLKNFLFYGKVLRRKRRSILLFLYFLSIIVNNVQVYYSMLGSFTSVVGPSLGKKHITGIFR